ncbi:uncharacterized protein KD926_008525 [Aspergillus affinis]|uniref:uncharacterized protein n=1 Tax=Aspergillus affinis TaxID=1070780 RepID=UPI0022FECC4C|nr:uncharacterized protein KD926_008525 [Aspergillus affinis]KAI9040201.1 hypothetical protein KD926_008525 [Aspergillus affinis]
MVQLWEEHCHRGSEPQQQKLADILDIVLETSQGGFFLLLDALDECPSTDHDERSSLLQFLEEHLGRHRAKIHILATSRLEPDIRPRMERYQSVSLETGLEEDVETFVRAQVVHGKLSEWGESVKKRTLEKLLDIPERYVQLGAFGCFRSGLNVALLIPGAATASGLCIGNGIETNSRNVPQGASPMEPALCGPPNALDIAAIRGYLEVLELLLNKMDEIPLRVTEIILESIRVIEADRDNLAVILDLLWDKGALHDQSRASHAIIDKRLVERAASNLDSGQILMEQLLDRKEKMGVKITENLLLAVISNHEHGEEIMDLLFDKCDPEIREGAKLLGKLLDVRKGSGSRLVSDQLSQMPGNKMPETEQKYIVRLPADGYHDVFKIPPVIYRLCGQTYHRDEEYRYRCWTCCQVIKGSRQFTVHVMFHEHCGFKIGLKSSWISGKRSKSRKWTLPFDEDTVLRYDGPFVFLDLPPELRIMVYRYLICFEEVKFSEDIPYWRKTKRRRDGHWWQYNLYDNLLAITAVNRQIYHEARRTFYTENRFLFENFEALPVFLVGIGVHNTRLLRSVCCRTKSGPVKDYTDLIRACVNQAATMERNTVNEYYFEAQLVEDLYLNLPDPDTLKPAFLPYDRWSGYYRRLRPDSPSVPDCSFRMRFGLRATVRQKGKGGVNVDKNYLVAFELCKQNMRVRRP